MASKVGSFCIAMSSPMMTSYEDIVRPTKRSSADSMLHPWLTFGIAFAGCASEVVDGKSSHPSSLCACWPRGICGSASGNVRSRGQLENCARISAIHDRGHARCEVNKVGSPWVAMGVKVKMWFVMSCFIGLGWVGRHRFRIITYLEFRFCCRCEDWTG